MKIEHRFCKLSFQKLTDKVKCVKSHVIICEMHEITCEIHV